MPKFLETTISNSFENIACTECASTHVDTVMHSLLKVAPANRVPQKFKVFHKNYRSSSNLFGTSEYDEDMQY